MEKGMLGLARGDQPVVFCMCSDLKPNEVFPYLDGQRSMAVWSKNWNALSRASLGTLLPLP